MKALLRFTLPALFAAVFFCNGVRGQTFTQLTVSRFMLADHGSYVEQDGTLDSTGFTSMITAEAPCGDGSVLPTVAQVSAVSGLLLFPKQTWDAGKAAYSTKFAVSTAVYKVGLTSYYAIGYGDAVPAATSPSIAAPRLINESVLTTVPAGGLMIVGFVITAGPIKILIRAAGPALTAFGVANPLATPSLTVYSSGNVVATNSGWSDTPADQNAVQTANSLAGAFNFAVGSHDSAVVFRPRGARATLGQTPQAQKK